MERCPQMKTIGDVDFCKENGRTCLLMSDIECEGYNNFLSELACGIIEDSYQRLNEIKQTYQTEEC